MVGTATLVSSMLNAWRWLKITDCPYCDGFAVCEGPGVGGEMLADAFQSHHACPSEIQMLGAPVNGAEGGLYMK